MQRLLAALLVALFVGAFLALMGIPLAVAVVLRHRDRRRILAEGRAAEALITKLVADARSDTCRICFSFQAETGGARLECTQESTLAVLGSLGLRAGSRVSVRYLPGWPRYAFIEELIVAERIAALKPTAAAGGAGEPPAPAVNFIAYADPARAIGAPTAFRWSGDGDITIGGEVVRFTAQRARPFWFPRVVAREFPRNALGNVEVFENAVRCEISAPYTKPRVLQFWAVSPEEARAIGTRLPDSKSATFAPQLAERAAFSARLLELSPRAPVTRVIIGINVALFVIAAALGAGILVPNGEALIRLGSDFTPLTAAGQWWRLLTSTFLHFGLLHLAFNMWALWVNGVLAERLYGSSRYLTLYLVAGVAGSVASFLWHPFVNGAGASGAIFGVLGALLAYFLRTDAGVPRSVLKAQRNTAAIFIVFSILGGAQVRGIDNAAHLGGLAAGFVMGWLLCRPLNAKRNVEDWTGQWVRALTLVAGSVLLAGYLLSTGRWHPRVVHDPSGRPISFAELATPPRTFGGATLGMTGAQLLRAKGKPVREGPNDWVYDSIDPAHDGVLEIYFKQSSDGSPATVRAVLFRGRREAEPPGMSDLLSFTRQDLAVRYGGPTFEEDAGRGARYLYFSNGIMVHLAGDKVRAYGVYTPRP